MRLSRHSRLQRLLIFGIRSCRGSMRIAFHHPLAFWLGCSVVAAGVCLHLPMYVMAAPLHFHLAGTPMDPEMLLGMDASGSESCAEELLQQSLDWARSQRALSWELRAVSSLARLRLRQGDPQEGRACLEPVYARFTQGFDTADLTAARQLLNGLNV